MIFSSNLTFDLIAIFSAVIVGVILLLKENLKYWSKRGLGTPLHPHILFGNAKSLILGQKSNGEMLEDHYKYFKSKGIKHGGILLGPQKVYLATDPETIKNIIQRDFAHFKNHGTYYNTDYDPLSGHLFNLEDNTWRNMRVKLTPTFTSGKMKMMFQTLADCTHGLKDILEEARINKEPVDIKEVLGRFTTDIIGSTAFGLECNSLKNPDSEFRKHGKKVFDVGLLARIKWAVWFCLPHSILELIRFRFTPSSVEKFFMKVVKDTVNYREKNNVYRKDFMHLLLQLKNRGAVKDDEKLMEEDGVAREDALTMDELAAQAFVFFIAGFETSSTTSTFTLHELAINQDIQDKLRKEINDVLKKHDNKLTYDAIMDMTYMDLVLQESLRKFPPVPILFRKCNMDYKIPGTKFVLEKGVNVAIPLLALHTDPEYYPNPDKFDPERFTEENKNSRHPFTFLPFGEGPRVCIGLRFGLMQSKVGLVALLQNYRLTLNAKTPQPIQFDPASLVSTVKDGVWLNVEKIN